MSKRTTEQWEAKFRSWAGGPGDTEQERCENAVSMIKKAIANCPELSKMEIEVFAQGSFRNNTNIAQESDVDVSVCLTETFYVEIPKGTNRQQFAINDSDRQFGPYKQQVLDAVHRHFKDGRVTRGSKAIQVHSNTYRVDADVVANWLFREYYDVHNPTYSRDGVRFVADDGKIITNYPKQHIKEGVAKNDRTGRRFKRITRVLKALQVEMEEQNLIEKRLPSFFIESLVFNVSDDLFGADLHRDDVANVVRAIWQGTKEDADSSRWTEVNRVKKLFHDTQPWTKLQAHTLAYDMWVYADLA